MTLAILVWARVWGGLESHVRDIAATALEDGHHVCLACVGDETARLFEGRAPGATIRIIEPPGSASNVRRWYTQLRSLGADACIFEKGTLHTGGVAMDLAARLAFKAFVTIQQLEPPALGRRTTRWHAGGLVPGLGLWWYRQRFSGWLRSLAPSRTICISNAVRDALRTDYGFSDRRLVVIHNGVNVERFTSGRNTEGSEAAHSSHAAAMTLGTSARLVQDKGIDVAIRAVHLLKTNAPEKAVRLLIANDGPERKHLEALVEQLGLCDRISFVGFQPEPAAFYQALDILLVPSRIEAQGLIVPEALASGCLVIASRVGGIPEMISAPELGTLVPPDDVPALADAIDRAVAMPQEERDFRAAAGRRHVETHFNARRQGRAILALVEGLVAGA